MAKAVRITRITGREDRRRPGAFPIRWRSVKLPYDNAFAEKLRGLDWLSVSPAAHAIALSVDNKARSRR